MHPVESKYNGICTITEAVKTTSQTTNITSTTDTEVCKDQPCRMVVKSVPATENKNGAFMVVKNIVLLMTPSITVKPGSKVTVTQEGRTEHFKSSGIPAVYPSHQEISLVEAERWA